MSIKKTRNRYEFLYKQLVSLHTKNIATQYHIILLRIKIKLRRTLTVKVRARNKFSKCRTGDEKLQVLVEEKTNSGKKKAVVPNSEEEVGKDTQDPFAV